MTTVTSVAKISPQPQVGNAAALFAGASPFSTDKSTFVTVHPPKWAAKSEAQYAVSTDFKGLLASARDFFPRVAPLTDELVDRTRHQAKPLAVLLYGGESPAAEKKFRCVHQH